MVAAPAHRTLRVFVPEWIVADGSVAAPVPGELFDSVLSFQPADAAESLPAQTFTASARPVYGRTPVEWPKRGLHWLLELYVDGWIATWWSDRPHTGRIELQGTLVADLPTDAESPVPVRGRIRQVQSGPGSGTLVDLDLDDVPPPEPKFVVGAVSAHGTEIWVMHRSDPVLLHIDTSAEPPRVTEYLLPMTIESPLPDWLRFPHADGSGCWITSHYDVFRCDRTGPASLTVERVCTTGGRGVVDNGRLHLLANMSSGIRIDRRYGPIRFDPDGPPATMLTDDGRLVTIDDPATIARLRARFRESLSDRAVYETLRSIDLGTRTRGTVRWIRPDPLRDPANAGLVPYLYAPTTHS